jgi:DNA-binding response OmpR family regulator
MAEKIYIVEDDPTIASALRAHLSAWGYQVGARSALTR